MKHVYKYNTRKFWQKMKRIQQGFTNIIAIDIETTGLDFNKHEIIQVGVVILNAKKQTMRTHVNMYRPEHGIPAESTKVHGITYAQTEGCPPSSEAAHFAFSTEMKKSLVIGYNIYKFDLPFLHHVMYKVTGKDFYEMMAPSHALDLYLLFKQEKPTGSQGLRATLSCCFKTFCGETLKGQHHAGTDAEACLMMLPAMVDFYKLPQGRKEFKALCKNRYEKGIVDKDFFMPLNISE
jgi:DNA polymerase III subunit epsilon